MKYRPCYKYVKPQPFMDACVREGCKCKTSPCECDQVHLYVSKCTSQGFKIPLKYNDGCFKQ